MDTILSLVGLILGTAGQESEDPDAVTRKRMEAGRTVEIRELALPKVFLLLMMDEVTFFIDPVAVPRPENVKITVKCDEKTHFGGRSGTRSSRSS